MIIVNVKYGAAAFGSVARVKLYCSATLFFKLFNVTNLLHSGML